MTAITTLVLCTALGGASSVAQAQVDPTLPNLVPMFPDVSRVPNNFFITNRIGGQPSIEFEILTSNIGGQDWIRPPINRDVACITSIQYFRMPQTHQYTVYWFDPDLGDYVQIDQRRKNTICIQDDAGRGRDPQNYCLSDHTTGRFPCGCTGYYGPGRGNGVSMGWSDSYFRGLAGQWARIGEYTGSFMLATELDPDQLLQAPDLLPEETDATHDDNISYVTFDWDGRAGCTTSTPCIADNVQITYTFAPVCPLP